MSNKGELLRCPRALHFILYLTLTRQVFSFIIDNKSVSLLIIDYVYILARSREIELFSCELFKGVPIGTEFIDAAVHFGGTLLIIAYLTFH